MRNLKAQHLHEIPLFPGVPEMLLTLAGHSVTLALVSSDREANVRRQLGAPVAALFQHFECGASLFGKPAKFNRVTKSAGLAPHQVVSIGDEVRDIDAARAAGIRCGAVTWGYADAGILRAQKPDFVFEAMADIAAAFQAPART